MQISLATALNRMADSCEQCGSYACYVCMSYSLVCMHMQFSHTLTQQGWLSIINVVHQRHGWMALLNLPVTAGTRLIK